MSAAVVPPQGLDWEAALALVKNAFYVAHGCRHVFFLIISGLQKAVKEGSWRELARVTHDNNLIASQECPERILRAHLAGLIEYNHIKASCSGIKELSYR